MSIFSKIILIGMVPVLFSCGSGKKKDPDKLYFEKASEYNSYINRQFIEVNRLWNATLAKMGDSTLVYKELDSLILASRSSMDNMSKLADFKGDTLYKQAAAAYFKYILTTAQTSFKEAIGIGLMEDVSDSLYVRFTDIGNQIGADKDSCFNRLKLAQLDFMRLAQK